MSFTPLLGLRWAIKRSFLDYIAHAPGGGASLTQGAVATEEREIVFGPVENDSTVSEEWERLLAFGGTATFTAHSGALLVPIANPWVAIRNSTGTITISDPFQRDVTARLNLATFRFNDHVIADGFEHWAAADVQLAPEACTLFNHVYPACTPLEPFTIIVVEPPSV